MADKRTIACVVARTTSTRLPLKILRRVDDEYRMIDFILQRLKKVSNIDGVYVCTSDEVVDDIMEDIAEDNQVSLYRGSPDSVIERLISVGEIERADNVIRITGDNVFTSTEYLDEQIRIHNENDLEYTRISGLPLGATAEVIDVKALKDCYGRMDPSVSEYLVLFMFKPDLYRCGVISVDTLGQYTNMTLTVDTAEDLERTRSILSKLDKSHLNVSLNEILDIVIKNDIASAYFKPNGTVKLPYGKEILYEDFCDDMNYRSDKSFKFLIDIK